MKNISLVLAASLLLLHTFVPHQHHTELDEAEHIAQHQQADDLFDILQLIFHADLGGDHLENFKTVNHYFVAPDFVDNAIELRSYTVVESDRFPQADNTYDPQKEISSLWFRGPPNIG